jgi:precorrin-6B methylase 2
VPQSTYLWPLFRRAIILFVLSLGLSLPAQAAGPFAHPAFTLIPRNTIAAQPTIYQAQRRPSSDGIGKIYMGREISQMMGHQGAGWLERPSRSTSERPQQFIPALHLNPTDIVADIGAGTGYISFRLAPLLPKGKVLAVDVQPEMLDILERAQQRQQITNVQTILGTGKDPHLAAGSIDLVLMVDAYHEFAYPREMMEALTKALKPSGRVVLVEYKAENPLIFIKPHHKMSVKQIRKEMQAVGLTWQVNQSVLPQQHVLTFQKNP